MHRDSLKAARHPSSDTRMMNTPSTMTPCGRVSPAKLPALVCSAYAPTPHKMQPKICTAHGREQGSKHDERVSSSNLLALFLSHVARFSLWACHILVALSVTRGLRALWICRRCLPLAAVCRSLVASLFGREAGGVHPRCLPLPLPLRCALQMDGCGLTRKMRLTTVSVPLKHD